MKGINPRDPHASVDLSKVDAWFKAHGGPVRCACGAIVKAIHGITCSPMFADGGAFYEGTPTLPTLVLGCDNCGRFHYYSAVMIGLAKQAPATTTAT